MAEIKSVKGQELFRAWYNTVTREFKVCKVLGQKEYREMFKIESVKEARERLNFVKKE